jgi:GNAT superfamily N-acetyltransferase
MRVREAVEADIPEIVNVLKSSLGETSSKKTENVWRYKHVDNPFGKSLVLVAVEEDIIIGVRALMKWEWQLGKKVFLAYRAVDTATLPKHQGKGVFKKLTLKAIEIVADRGDSFIFNTPNSQSLPGYLKMEWHKVDNIKIQLLPTNPLKWFNKKLNPQYQVKNSTPFDHTSELISKYNLLKSMNNKLFTVKSPEYLTWRYEKNSLQKYEVRSDEDFYLAAYIKRHKYFNELRVVEHIYNKPIGLLKIRTSIKELKAKFNPQLISISEELNLGFGISGKIGPILTLRNVNLDNNIHQELLQLNNWSYALGDLELF